jgi:hypothetical protein
MTATRSLDGVYQALSATLQRREHDSTTEDLRECTQVEEPTRRHYRRLDIVAAGALLISTRPACGKGCSYCCHDWVPVLANEVFLAGEAVAAIADRTVRRGVIDTVHRNAARAQASIAAPHLHRPVRCAMLAEDDSCLIYKNRPEHCRNRHSTSLDSCLADFVEGGSGKGILAKSTACEVVNTASRAGFVHALEAGGQDTREYEMSSALSEYLRDPHGCRARYDAGKQTFLHAVVGVAAIDAPPSQART